MIVYIVLALLTFLVYQIYFRNKRMHDLVNKIPGPPPLPIIGNLLMFNVTTEQLWNILRDLNNKYPISKFWLGPSPIISIHHPDDIEILLSSQKHIDKGFVYKCLRPWLKSGLVTSNGAKWQHRRKILTPAFHFRILKKYISTINEKGKLITEDLKNKDKETVQNLIPYCANYTLKIICESAMGISLDKIDSKSAKDYEQAIHQIGNIVLYRAIRPFIQDWMLNSLWETGRIHQQALKTLHGFTDKVLKERKEYHNRTDNQFLKGFDEDVEGIGQDDVFIGRKKKLAMLDLLLSAEQEGLIDDEGIKEEVDTFMFAGHDTIGMALVYTILLLAENKEIQNKARAEITPVLDKSKGEIGLEEIQEFQYLERCIKESLRIFPPVSTISRRMNEDLQLKNYLIPAGAEIGCHMFDLHRNPDIWPEPTKYDPDRFLPERIQGRHPFSYLPFSAGPRNCIGQKFAMIELKSVLARILYNFKLDPVTQTSDIKLVVDLVTRPSKPVYARFIKIDK